MIIYLNRNKNKLMSDRNTSIKDDDSNFYKLSKFLFFMKNLKGNDYLFTMKRWK